MICIGSALVRRVCADALSVLSSGEPKRLRYSKYGFYQPLTLIRVPQRRLDRKMTFVLPSVEKICVISAISQTSSWFGCPLKTALLPPNVRKLSNESPHAEAAP